MNNEDPNSWLVTRYVWGYYARWWDCVEDVLDMEVSKGSIPGLFAQRWWYCELYETEDQCIAETQEQAEKEFADRYPWIMVFHIVRVSEFKPEAANAQKRKRKVVKTPSAKSKPEPPKTAPLHKSA